MSRSLEQVLADHRGEAQVIRAHGHKAQADSIERVVDDVAEVMEAYLDWLSESQAMSRSNRSVEFLRARFSDWEAADMARWSDEKPARRQYRRLIIPLRANLDAARAEALREAQKSA